MYRFFTLTLTLLAGACTSYSSHFQNEEGGYPEPSRLLKNAQGENQQLAAIGRLRAAMSCTAALWRASPDANAPVLALTNGHCVMPYADRASSYAVWTDRAAPAGWTLTLNHFVDTPNKARSFPVQSIVYATMKGMDIGIIALKASWAEMQAAGLDPLRLAADPTPAGIDIRVIGAPERGFAAEEQFLREASCVNETRVSIAEWYWTFWDAHRNSCADVREGSSGSPVLNAAGEVFALINTTSAGAISDTCYLGNPCELQRPGAAMKANKNYAIDLWRLDRCFGAKGLEFGSHCPLPAPATVAYKDAPFVPTRPVDRQGKTQHWQVSSDPALWKFGPVGEIDCRNIRDYREASLPTGELPTENGVYLLCLLASGADERFPTTVVLSIDTKGPTQKPELSMRSTDRGMSFEPIFAVPELSNYFVGHGPLAGTSCETLPLTVYRRIPILVEKNKLPARVCVRAEDNVGNPGPVFEYELKAP